MQNTFEDWQKEMLQPSVGHQIISGFEELDKLALFSSGEIVILGGSAGTGLNAFQNSLVHNLLKTDISVGYVNLQYPNFNILNSLCARELGIPLFEFGNKKKGKAIFRAIQEVADSKFQNVHQINKIESWEKFEIQIETMVADKNLKVVVVDEYALFSHSVFDHPTKTNHIQLFNNIRKLAQKLDITFFISVALSEERWTDVPKMTDLEIYEETISFADKVLLFVRLEMYGIEMDSEYNSTRGLIEILIRKHLFVPNTKLFLHNHPEIASVETAKVDLSNVEFRIQYHEPFAEED